MATFHFKLLENFLEVQSKTQSGPCYCNPLIFLLIYSSVLLGPICTMVRHVRKWYKTCGAEVKAWVASVGMTTDGDYVDKATSITQTTVVQLLEPLSGKNPQVYMNNYYTSLPLFSHLLRIQIFATGTVRTNRKGLDKTLTMKKEEERQLKKNLGTTWFSSYGSLVYAAWFNKRHVHILSNRH